ncbi:MAG: hypothetical protein R3F49_00600 [Planctomycetota bacterium]
MLSRTPSSSRSNALRACSALLLLTLFGCATDAAAVGRPGAVATSARGALPGAEGARAARQAEQKVEAARGKVAVAELAVQLQRLEGEAQVAEAQEDLRAAEVALEEARSAQAAFDLEARVKVGRSEEELASDESRLIAERADLAGIRAIYAVETEARAKDEILRRHENDVLRAERALALTTLEHQQLTAVTLPQGEREHAEHARAAQAKVGAKQRELELARLAAQKGALAAQRDLAEARAELQEAEATAAERSKAPAGASE